MKYGVFFNELQRLEKTDFLLIHPLYLAENKIHMEEWLQADAYKEPSFHPLQSTFNNVLKAQQPLSPFIPVLHYHGTNNRFHLWLKDFFAGSLGYSYKDYKPVGKKIIKAFYITFAYAFPSFLIIWLISIPLGVYLSSGRTTFNSILKSILYILDATPLFWISLLLLLTFSSGILFNIFPVYGLGGMAKKETFIASALETLHHLTLPVVALVLTGVPYVSRQVEKNMVKINKDEFIRTARAKGVPPPAVIWKHAFRNSQIPLLTIFWSHLPAIFGGALIVEIVFTLPGIGMLLIESVQARDYPVIIGIIIISALLKITSMILSDLSYYWADPRIKYAS